MLTSKIQAASGSTLTQTEYGRALLAQGAGWTLGELARVLSDSSGISVQPASDSPGVTLPPVPEQQAIT
jgi:hypothetical protein